MTGSGRNATDTPNDILKMNPTLAFAIELIEADRLATDRDTYKVRAGGENKIVRGVELDDNIAEFGF